MVSLKQFSIFKTKEKKIKNKKRERTSDRREVIVF